MWVLGIKSCPHTCRASKFSDRAILLSSIHSLDEGKQAKEDTTPHLVQSHGLTPNCLSRTGAVPRRGTCAKRIPEESVSKSHQNPSQLSGETAPQVIPEQTSSFCIARADPKGNGWVQSRHPLFSFFNLRPGKNVCGVLIEYFKISTQPRPQTTLGILLWEGPGCSHLQNAEVGHCPGTIWETRLPTPSFYGPGDKTQ